MSTTNEDRNIGEKNEQMPLLSRTVAAQRLSPPFRLPLKTRSSPTASTSIVTGGSPQAPASPAPTNQPGAPAGLSQGREGDEGLSIFQHAVGINSQPVDDTELSTVEQGRKSATGIYRAVIKGRHLKIWQYTALSIITYTCHLLQILVGATLTAFGPVAGNHAVAITVLGSINTVIAGILALFKGQGLQERLHKDEIEFTRLQVWIEETHALLEAGVIGRDRQEVDLLVETVFRKYNAVLASEENNRPDSYIRQEPEGGEGEEGDEDHRVHGPRNGNLNSSRNAVIQLDLPNMRPMA